MTTPGPKPGRNSRLRTAGEPRSLVQAYVKPETKARAHHLADACGASMALMLELMIQNQPIDPATGRPVWWDDAVKAYEGSRPEELPLTG